MCTYFAKKNNVAPVKSNPPQRVSIYTDTVYRDGMGGGKNSG